MMFDIGQRVQLHDSMIHHCYNQDKLPIKGTVRGWDGACHAVEIDDVHGFRGHGCSRLAGGYHVPNRSGWWLRPEELTPISDSALHQAVADYVSREMAAR